MLSKEVRNIISYELSQILIHKNIRFNNFIGWKYNTTGFIVVTEIIDNDKATLKLRIIKDKEHNIKYSVCRKDYHVSDLYLNDSKNIIFTQDNTRGKLIKSYENNIVYIKNNELYIIDEENIEYKFDNTIDNIKYMKEL